MSSGVSLNALNRRYEVRTQTTLIDASICAGFDGSGQEQNRVMLTHHHDLGGRHFFPENTRYVQSIEAGHADVEKNQIRQELSRFLNGVCPVFGFAADFTVTRERQNIRHAMSDQCTVVGNENSHKYSRSALPSQKMLVSDLGPLHENLRLARALPVGSSDGRAGKWNTIFVPSSVERMSMWPPN
jgi:hypothetical protein